jgi:hypothetical protein
MARQKRRVKCCKNKQRVWEMDGNVNGVIKIVLYAHY